VRGKHHHATGPVEVPAVAAAAPGRIYTRHTLPGRCWRAIPSILQEHAMSRIIAVPLVAALALPLAACAPMPPSTGGPLPPTAFQCVAEPGAWAIGKEATADVVERIRVDTHSRVARVLRPGQVVTMEFSAERVNVNVNDRNAIIGVTCG
jgi:hypothetical protein